MWSFLVVDSLVVRLSCYADDEFLTPSGLLPVFSNCFEWLAYGTEFRNEGGTVMLRLESSTVQDGFYDFEARCDDEGWMTILARDAESGSELVSYLK